MRLRNLILILFIAALFSACVNRSQSKAYAITTYFTSFANSSNSMGKEKQKFKYAYEEYNADSNMIYEELYATSGDPGNMWGKLFARTEFFYNGKKKIKAEKEFGIAYPRSQTGRGKGKGTYTYEYTREQLTKWLLNGEPVEEYKYNDQNQQVEKRIANGPGVPIYYRFTYNNGVKTKTQHFLADTIILIDTFIYDKHQRLVEVFSYRSNGEKAGHRLTIRNDKGQAIEEKWREPYNGWRMRNNGQIIEGEFYQSNKYYYDSKGRPAKTEFYDIGKLMMVYEFTYD